MFLTDWIHPLSHCEDALMHLVKLAGIKISRTTLQKELSEHPDYPSLLAIVDVLRNFGVDNLAVRVAIDEWDYDFSCPFLAHIKSSDLVNEIFVVVRNLSKEKIEFYSPESKKIEIMSWDNFNQIYKGVILVIEPSENAGEKEYRRNSIKELQSSSMQTLAFLALPIITIIFCIFTLYNQEISDPIGLIVFLMLSLTGFIVSMLLIWHEIDEYNPVLRQICQGGSNVNCSAILNSSASKFFGISWSSIGFTYFTGMLLLLIISGKNYPAFVTLLSVINIAAIPYVFFSIYYQWRVAKQWCILCLAVQSILVLQLATNISYHFYDTTKFSNIHASEYLSVVSVFLIVFVFILVLIPALQKEKSTRLLTMELQRIKHSPQIIDSLILKNKQIELPKDILTIQKGNPNGKFKLLIVCNPYCNACSKAHIVLEELLVNNEELDLKLIFTATENEDDPKREPVMHFLAISQIDQSDLIKRALDDWYHAPEKNYQSFAEKHPIGNELLDAQIEKIKLMNDWCESVKVLATPTLFINGHELPEMYSVSDLKYYFNV